MEQQQQHHHLRTNRLQHHHLEVASSMSKSSSSSVVADNEKNDQLQLASSNMKGLAMSSSTSKTGAESSSSSSSAHCDIWRMTSPAEIATKLVLMTQAPRICFELRNDGILPLLVQFLHQHSTEDGLLALSSTKGDRGAGENGYHQQQQVQATGETFRSTLALRRSSAKALRNIVTHTTKSKHEVEILGLLEDLRSFVEIFYLKWSEASVEAVDHPCSQLAEICDFACDANYRKTIELLGGVYVIADVIQSDYRFHRAGNSNDQCLLLRQYSLNVLTQMTAQSLDPVKSVLASMRPFIDMLVETLQEASQLDKLPLLQSAANVLHNLSWKADFNSRQIMRDVKTVGHLVKMAMNTKDLTTLKALLEPLLNLTAHCTPNKVDFCKVEGVLDFLISKLKTATLPSTSSTSSSSSSTSHSLNSTELAIVENIGGILRNIASYLVTQEDLIEQLRARNIVALLLEQLKSPSLAIVSNACITLSYLVIRSPKDALKLKELGGIQLLHGLTSSKHDPIKLGASKMLQHLYATHRANHNATFKDSPAMSTSYSISSSLQMSKMNAFKTEMANSSFQSENYEPIKSEISPNSSLNRSHNLNSQKALSMNNSMVHSGGGSSKSSSNTNNNFHPVTRSSSQDSVGSTHSEPGTKKSQSVEQHENSSSMYMNLVNASGGASPLDHRPPRMIASYSGQAINSIYATLPANSRIRQKQQLLEKDSNDISSCSLIGKSPSGNLKNNNSSSNNQNNGSSTADYLNEEEEEDPAPTDYSQRFKEQVIDDFSTPQSASKTDTSTSEDTVKVYQTENTPLVFSLAPSLSDLRDLGGSAGGGGGGSGGLCGYPQNRLVDTKHDELSDSFSSLELNGKSMQQQQQQQQSKRPNLAPKPPAKLSHTSASAYNLKIPYSINEEAAVETATANNSNKNNSNYGQSNGVSKLSERNEQGASLQQYADHSRSMGSILYNNDNYGQARGANNGDNSWTASKSPSEPRWSSGGKPSNSRSSSSALNTPLRAVIANSVNRHADSLEHFAARDSSQLFATENTPAFFSHATSLSSLSIEDDQPDDQGPCFATGEQKAPQVVGAQMDTGRGQNTGDNSNDAAAYQNYATASANPPSPDQHRPKSPSSTSLGKATPVAAKRMSKSQTAQNSSEQAASSAVQFYSDQHEQRQQHSPSPPPRPPKKPLPAIPRDESPPRMHGQLPPTPTSPSSPKDDDYDDFIYKCRQAALPKQTSVKPKAQPSSVKSLPPSSATPKSQSPPNQSSPSPYQTTSNQSSANTPQHTHTSETPNTKSSNENITSRSQSGQLSEEEVEEEDDDDDEDLLTKCMQVAIDKQSHAHSHSHSRSSSRRAAAAAASHSRPHSNAPSREGKSPRIYKRNPAATTPSTSSHHQHHLNHVLKLPLSEPSPVEQEQHFYVEDTPVHFSQCHSPLSALFDSADEIEDQQLVEAAAQFDAARNQVAQQQQHQQQQQQQQLQQQQQQQQQRKAEEEEEEKAKYSDESSEPESEATGTVINNAAAVAAPSRQSAKRSSTERLKSRSTASEKRENLLQENLPYDQVPIRRSPAYHEQSSGTSPEQVVKAVGAATAGAMVARTSNTRTYRRVEKASKSGNTGGDLTVNAEREPSSTKHHNNNKHHQHHQHQHHQEVPLQHGSQSQAVSMPLFSNPMDSPKGSNKKPPPAPRYQPRTMQLAPSNFELTDDSSDDERFLRSRYSQSLNNRRSAPQSKNSAKNSNVAFAQQRFGNSQFESLNSGVQYSEQYSGQFYPQAQHHHPMAFSSLGRRGHLSLGKVKMEKNFEDKNLLYTAAQSNAEVAASQAQFFNQSKSNAAQGFKSASKYFDRHVAAFSSSLSQSENQFPVENAQHTNHPVIEQIIPLPTTSKQSNSNDHSQMIKPNEKEKEKRSSIFSKLSSPFSSHNSASNSANSGRSTPTSLSTQSSTKSSLTKLNSKIASFWKRSSKSSQDKLDHQEALTVNPSKNMKAAKINKIFPSQQSTDSLDILDLNQNQVTTQLGENIDHPYGAHPNGNQFTFSTFVKSPANNFSSSVESVSTHSSADRFRSEMNYLQQQHQQREILTAKSSTSSSDPTDAADSSPVDDTSGTSSKGLSSGQQSRKTCLVTTV